jgi:hypothetical protein
MRKLCENCKYSNVSPEDPPCKECVESTSNRPAWEPKEESGNPPTECSISQESIRSEVLGLIKIDQ